MVTGKYSHQNKDAPSFACQKNARIRRFPSLWRSVGDISSPSVEDILPPSIGDISPPSGLERLLPLASCGGSDKL